EAAVSKVEQGIERVEFEFERAPLLEVELTKYLTSDVRKARAFEVTATLVEPLRTETGLLILPAQTKLRLTASVRPGKQFGHPGEVVLWLNPFSIGKGIEGFACEPATVATEASPTPKIHPLICQNTWRMAFDHQLDYAATPEAGRPLILERKRHHEGISGTRASHPPNVFYDPSSGNLDNRIQLAASRFQLAGIVYEIGAAFTGAVRLLFSKRDVFLPAGTRVVFQLEQKLRLVPAGDTPVQILPVKTVAQPPGS
ncbi:MAG TPA: hypothetical protein PLD20_34465, partial [Blastocatellia bacterium]|nr:hypothetical protein [Blastocatellia bacterium]